MSYLPWFLLLNYATVLIFIFFFYFQVKVLYDFDGDPDNGELSVRAGEELTVTAQVSRLKK